MQNIDRGEVFSIASLCKSYGISRALFYKLQRDGKAPRTFNLGRRVLISRDAAQAWLAKMEGTAA